MRQNARCPDGRWAIPIANISRYELSVGVAPAPRFSHGSVSPAGVTARPLGASPFFVKYF
eukprot:7386079-Prymnesium_polylepis.3